MAKNSLKNENNNKIKEFMIKGNLWEDRLCSELPQSYEKFGDMLLFTSPVFQSPNWHNAGDQLWEFVCSLYKGKRIGLKSKIQNDHFRTPEAKLIYGDSPYTNFLDNKIKYTWNIETNMFCAGNITERHRIASLDCSGEVVVDLFAGIGYFTLPYLVHAKAKFVHACEWNPNAIEALKMNLRANKVADKCAVYFGDNREVCPKNVANRVNLGLIPSSSCSWETACHALIPSGGIFYIHENVTTKFKQESCQICQEIIPKIKDSQMDKEFPVFEMCKINNIHQISTHLGKFKAKMEWFEFSIHLSHLLIDCFQRARGESWKVKMNEIFKVKSYAPHIDHLVFSVYCSPNVENV